MKSNLPLLILIALHASLLATPALAQQAAPENSQSQPQSPDPAATPAAKAPFRIAFINATGEKEKGDDVYFTLDDYLLTQPTLERINPNTLLDLAQKHNLTLNDLRDKKARQNRADDLKKLIHEARAEAFLILEVYGKGRKTQLIALDHDGNELVELRKNIRRSKIKSDDAEKLAVQALEKVTPSIEAFRAQGGYPPLPKEKPAEETLVAPERVAPLPTESAAPETSDPSQKPSGIFSADALFLFHRTEIEMKNDSNDKVSYEANSIGGALRLGSKFLTLGDYLVLGVSGFGGYSPFKTTVLNTTTKVSKEKDSFVAFGQLQLNVELRLGDTFSIIPFVGGDYKTLHIDEDQDFDLEFEEYSYLGARGGLMFALTPSNLDISLSLAAIPSFITKVLPKEYGDPEFTMSYEGRFVASYRVWSMLRLMVGYDFRFVMTQFKSAEGVFSGKASPRYQEMSHMAYGGLGVIF